MKVPTATNDEVWKHVHVYAYICTVYLQLTKDVQHVLERKVENKATKLMLGNTKDTQSGTTHFMLDFNITADPLTKLRS